MAFANKRLGQFWPILIALIAALLCTSTAARIVSAVDYKTVYSDFFPFWLAGNLVAHGNSPYDSGLWNSGYSQNGVVEIIDHSFLYPLPLAFLFVPLGLLPVRSAQMLWVAGSMFVILVSVLVMSTLRPKSRLNILIIPLLAGLIFYRPVVLTLVTGHISSLILFLVTTSILLFEKNKPFWGGFILAFLLLKPNLGLPLAAFLAIWLLQRSRQSAFLGMASSGLFLLAGGLLFDPHWLVEYLQISSGKLTQAFGFSPTVWGLAHLACSSQHACTLAAGVFVAAIFGIPCLWLLMRCRAMLTPLWAFSLAICIILLVTPYTWTYDQLLLLIPIAFITFALGEHQHGFLPAALFFIGLDILSLFLLFFNTLLDVEILNAFIPIIVLGFIFWVLLRKKELHDSSSPIIQVEYP